MTPNLLEQIHLSMETYPVAARRAADVYSYCTTIAAELQSVVDETVVAVEVTRQQTDESQENIITVVINDMPYAALRLTLANQQDAPVFKLWGDAVAKMWLQELEARTGSLVEKLTAITEELWSASQRNEKSLDMVCRRIVDAVNGVDRVSIVLNAEDHLTGTVAAAFPTDTVGQQIKLTDYGITDLLQRTREPIVIHDVQTADEVLGPNKGILQAFAVKSIMILPITIEREFVGSIGFDAIRHEHHFTSHEVTLLQSVVRQIALYLKMHQSGEQGTDRPVNTQQQAMVNEMIQAVPLRSNVESLMRSTAENMARRLNASTVRLYLNPTPLETDNRDEK